ncbi:hypothetical protein SRABI112_01681 [Pseudomonas mediterranea]|nr:hypothetical protein SRABI112_01681 [Pseudomonas mediterranea]
MDTFLQRRQRVDILHIARAARHRCHDPVNRLLIELDQREHVRGDPFTAGGDQVRRHLDLFAAADGRGQRRQGRLAEQDPHVSAQTGLAHALDQTHRQQRMAAQFEEMIMATNALDLEQVLP